MAVGLRLKELIGGWSELLAAWGGVETDVDDRVATIGGDDRVWAKRRLGRWMVDGGDVDDGQAGGGQSELETWA